MRTTTRTNRGRVHLLRPTQTITNRNSTAAVGYQVKSDERRNINAKVGIRYP